MFFTHEDIKIYYEKYGNKKKAIVILPGWGDTRKTFETMIPFLQEYFTVYILDYPGFGKSPFPNHDLTIYDYAHLVYEWLNELQLEDPILIGHSFGGRIIIALTGYYQYSFSNIILIDSAGIKPKKNLSQKCRIYLYKFLKKIKKILPKKYRERYQKKLLSIFGSTDYQNLPNKMMQTFRNVVNEDLKPYLKNIKSKTLLLWGNLDEDTPVEDSYIMNRLIPNSENIILDGLTHFSYLQRPLLFNQIIYEQLKDEIRE